MALRLQPLRIPAGWSVGHNSFHELDPTEDLGDDGRPSFKEDPVQLTCERHGRLLDLGWYPDDDISGGAYRVVVHAGDYRGNCLHSPGSRERLTIVAEIERLLIAVAEGRL